MIYSYKNKETLDTGILETGILNTGIMETGILDTGILYSEILDTGILGDARYKNTERATRKNSQDTG